MGRNLIPTSGRKLGKNVHFGAPQEKPYGFYWEEVHADSGTVVNDGFAHDFQDVPTGKSNVSGFKFRNIALYNNGGVMK